MTCIKRKTCPVSRYYLSSQYHIDGTIVKAAPQVYIGERNCQYINGKNGRGIHNVGPRISQKHTSLLHCESYNRVWLFARLPCFLLVTVDWPAVTLSCYQHASG